jgi:hypothetical protein
VAKKERSVFLGIPQYRRLTDPDLKDICEKLGLTDYEPKGTGFHPMIEIAYGKIAHVFKDTNVTIDVRIIGGDPMIDRARSRILTTYMEHVEARGEAYDMMLQMDDDIAFEPWLITSLLDAKKDVIGAAYAHKTTEGKKTGQMVSRILQSERIPDGHGLMKIRWLGGGCTAIRHSALMKMIKAYSDLHFHWETKDDQRPDGWNLWLPFVKELTEEDDVYEKEVGHRVLLSEDYAFCQRAWDCGLEVWQDCKPKLVHWQWEKQFLVNM